MRPHKYARSWNSYYDPGYVVYFTFKNGEPYPLYETPKYAEFCGYLHPYAELTSV